MSAASIGVIPYRGDADLLRTEELAVAAGLESVVVDARADVASRLTGYDVAVVLDPCCPGVTVDQLREVVTARPVDGVAAGVLAVTDTIKAVDGATVTGTVDRDRLCEAVTPIVLPASLAIEHARLLGEPPGLIGDVAARVEVALVELPPVIRG